MSGCAHGRAFGDYCTICSGTVAHWGVAKLRGVTGDIKEFLEGVELSWLIRLRWCSCPYETKFVMVGRNFQCARCSALVASIEEAAARTKRQGKRLIFD